MHITYIVYVEGSNMDARQMFGLAERLANAKSRQDIPEALKLLHSEMVLGTPCLGTRAEGLEENAAALARWFATFPDYQVDLEGHASDGASLVCWGTLAMTMTGNRFGGMPNGKRAVLPVYIHFTFRDGLIASERFSFDLASLCAQSGVSTDAARARLFRDRDKLLAPSAQLQTTEG
jgi:predicted ester cyclase